MANSSQSIEWLPQNRDLRMDANRDLFPEARRRFHLARNASIHAWCKGKKASDSPVLGDVWRKTKSRCKFARG